MSQMSNMDKLLAMSALAYKEGLVQKTKTDMRKEKLFSKVQIFSVRNGYLKMIWASYKAGRFAAKHGDK